MSSTFRLTVRKVTILLYRGGGGVSDVQAPLFGMNQNVFLTVSTLKLRNYKIEFSEFISCSVRFH